MADFISQYLEYASASSETPMVFHRWSCMSGLGAFLGRRYNFKHGHFTIQPNMYCMLIGTSGTRKSSGIKIMKNLLIKSGYTTFAGNKVTKEKFILDLAGESDEVVKSTQNLDDILNKNLWGDDNMETAPDTEMYIAADEFNDFFGNNILEFISFLGNLWDYEGVYENRIKGGKSVKFNNPTINILGGNTPTNFASAFPSEIFGQGFFSRLLLIYGESNGRRIAFPEPPDEKLSRELLEFLQRIKSSSQGPATLTNTARKLLEKIYSNPANFDDVRFESFYTRRFNHLLKLCLITSAARAASTITESDVVYANTVLYAAEQLMPKALGEFGKAKNSDVTHKVLQVIYNNHGATTFKELWKNVSNDLESPRQLGEIILNLMTAEKIQKAGSNGDLLPLRKIVEVDTTGSIDLSLLTDEERRMKK